MKVSNPAKIFKAVELASDHLFIEDHLAPEGFDTDTLSTKSVPLFKKYGIKVPMSYSEIYSMYNGNSDERYISNGLYYYYITPYLMNLNLVPAYDDKNLYGMLFPNIKQPEVLLRNMNNRYFTPPFYRNRK